MEQLNIKEALETAIMLGEVAQTGHTVKIDGIGDVKINSGSAALFSKTGKWKTITKGTIKRRINELMAESTKEKTKRRMETLVFS